MEALYMHENSNCTKFEFLANYKQQCKTALKHEIKMATKKVVTLKMECILFKKYLERTELNSFQGYILCDFLTMLLDTDLVQMDDEAMHVYLDFVMFCKEYLLNIDVDQVFCVSHKFYTVLFDILMAMQINDIEDDLTLFQTFLEEMTDYFNSEDTHVRKFVLYYTFMDDRFVTKMMDIHAIYNMTDDWFELVLRLYNFLQCIGYSYSMESPMEFSHKCIEFFVLLVRDGGAFFFSSTMLTLFIALEFYPEPDFVSHLNLDFIHYCVFEVLAEEQDPEFDTDEFKISIMHPITCVLDQMMIKGFVVPQPTFARIFDAYLNIYASSDSLFVEEEVLKFLFAMYKSGNYDLKAGEGVVLSFLENIICEDDDEVVLYLQVLLAILTRTPIHSMLIFKHLCIDYKIFTFDETTQRLYAAVMCKFLEYDDRGTFSEYMRTLRKYPECLDVPYMKYVKHVLVNTSLFDKCKLYIQENAEQWSRDELREIEHLI